MEYKRVIIVGTIPYNKNTSSRAFDAYFHNWEKKNLRQIFSNTQIPTKGHCSSLYQITDARMLKRWFHRIDEPGIIFCDQDLPNEWKSTDLKVSSKVINTLYKIGSKDSPLKYILRGILWRKKYWNTNKLNMWLDEFSPECVFLAFSDDYFIPRIALYISKKYNIPIMSCIGDDYYFNDRKSISPFYHYYRRTYKKLINAVFKRYGSAIYIGNKIRDQYNNEFGLEGETVYLTSDIIRHPFRRINTKNPKIVYCGNVRLGRNNSLVDIGKALQKINKSYYIDVYSTEQNKEFLKKMKSCVGIRFHGAISYSEVMRVTAESDISIIVEGFERENINKTRYSLSTKAADAIASGGNIFVYGAIECGVIEYMKNAGCAEVCVQRECLEQQLREFIGNPQYQKQLYDQAIRVDEEDHNKEKNRLLAESMIEKLVEKTRKNHE